MPYLTNSIAATMRFNRAVAPELFSLANPICWCLRQADVRILRQDMALDGDSMVFDTDKGTIRVEETVISDDRVEIVVDVRADETQDVMVARQICYQLIQRLCYRAKIASIVWQPSLQILRPAQFTWAVLQDMPRRFGEVASGRRMSPYGMSIH